MAKTLFFLTSLSALLIFAPLCTSVLTTRAALSAEICRLNLNQKVSNKYQLAAALIKNQCSVVLQWINLSKCTPRELENLRMDFWEDLKINQAQQIYRNDLILVANDSEILRIINRIANYAFDPSFESLSPCTVAELTDESPEARFSEIMSRLKS